MRCDKCSREELLHQPYSGLHLCREHFIADFQAKAKRAIRTHGGLCRHDHIAVAIYRGDADVSLLHFLVQLTGRRKDITLSAILVADTPYGRDFGEEARAFCAAKGVDCITVSVAEESGTNATGIAHAGDGSGTCCDAFLRSVLHRAAARHAVTKLALGYSLNDGAQMVLAEMLRGKPDRLLRILHPDPGAVIEIRPFMYAPSEEVALYSSLILGSPARATPPCPGDALDADANAFLDSYSGEHPSTRYALISLGEQIAAASVAAGAGGSLSTGPCDRPGGACRICMMPGGG
jgi:tRNA(Ile)-lysidine synthase TilS/MesJ